MNLGPNRDEVAKGHAHDDPLDAGPVMSASAPDAPGGNAPADPSSDEIRPGQVLLKNFLVKKFLGAGGMGSVWLVEDQNLTALRALKLIAPEYAKDPDIRERFKREARVMAQILHQNAVAIQIADFVGVRPAIVMEYIEGVSLNNRLKSGPPFTLDQVGKILTQLCAVLQVAHNKGIVHRDLKPSNMMLTSSEPPGAGSLKVLDFGLAKILGGEQSDALTRTTALLGTIPYMSPEQVRNEHVDARSDIYSTGVILYELLTGKRPFRGSEAQVIYDHLHTPPPQFWRSNPGCCVPSGVEQVVMQCLNKDPAQRPASAQALAETFQKAMTPEPGSTIAKPSPMPKPVLKLKPWLPYWPVAAGALAVVAVVVLAYHFLLGAGSRGVVTFRFDAPVDGLTVELDQSVADLRKPLTLSRGTHRIIVTQGDFVAADTTFRVSSGGNTIVPVSLKRQATLRVRPPSAKVSVAGAPQSTAKDGSLPLVFDGSQSLEIQAREDGYTTFSERLNYGALAGRRFEILLKRDDNVLAEKARTLLRQYCHQCHGVDFKAPGLDVLDRTAMVSLRAPAGGQSYLVPGRPDDSAIWKQIAAGKMPPEEAKQQPTSAEKEVLRSWIESGAPSATDPRRPFRSEEDVLTAVKNDLHSASGGDRGYYRYFTLTHLSNNPAVRDDELVLYRAALSKAVNSLSRSSGIVVPRAIDRDETIYRIDLRHVQWNWSTAWSQLLEHYPYRLDPVRTTGGRNQLWQLSREVSTLSGSERPYVRADWFIARATRPPLYHDLLVLPVSARDLETILGVNVEDDFKNNKVARGGVTTSDISAQHRLLERHAADSKYSYYWKSYDFGETGAEADLFRFPLGPGFEGNPFTSQAFRHASSALIFGLPNGLQAYMLVDRDGNRVDAAGSDVLSDPQAASGTRKVVNGLSCMGCHRLGVNPFEDEIRGGNSVKDEALQKVEEIYPLPLQMRLLTLRDQLRFRSAMAEAVGPFLRSGDQKSMSFDSIPEPIELAARRFLANLDLVGIACELGVEDVEALREQIQRIPDLEELGLRSIVTGATIKRPTWESTKDDSSLFQRVGSALRFGVVPTRQP